MTLSKTGEIPPDVHEMLLHYWNRREVARWTTTTKQDPVTPLEHLCKELREARSVIGYYRDGLVRANRIGTSRLEEDASMPTALEHAKEDAQKHLAALLMLDADVSQFTTERRWMIQFWMQTRVRQQIVDYAHLEVQGIEPLRIEIPLHDIQKLSAVVVALQDAENEAPTLIPSMASTEGDNDGPGRTGKDRATAWLLHQWRHFFPNLSRKMLARYIYWLKIEPGPPEKIEDRLRKAEGRRKGVDAKSKNSARVHPDAKRSAARSVHRTPS